MRKQRTSLHRLKNGRTIEYAEYGDPKGIPLFYLHCFMGSCHQGVLAHSEGSKQGFRVIAPNRPGIGKSSPANFRKMTNYAADIGELADHLGIDTFAVVGASSGGSFALACGHELQDRARLVGVAGCLGPMNVVQNMKNLPFIRRMMLNVCYLYPRVAWLFIAAFFQFCRLFPKLSYQWIIRTSSVLDAKTAAQPEISRILWWDHQSVLLQRNAIQGLLMELRLYFNWGFDVKNLRPETRVLLWHGTQDPILPWSAIHRMSQMIPNSEAILCKGGHLTFLMHKTKELFTRLKEEWEEVRKPTIRHEHPALSTFRQLRHWIASPFHHIAKS